jgi:transketolase
MNAVGMAMAESHLAAKYNRDGHEIVDHLTYAFCSDGDLMEGASTKQPRSASHLGLGKLICVYDDNHITIEGNTILSYSDDVTRRFEGYHWHVQNLGERANDIEAIAAAFAAAKEEKERPSLIILRSHIGYGAPNRQDTPEAHGEPLGEDEIRLAKKLYVWPEQEKFLVPDQVLAHMRRAIEQGMEREEAWNARYSDYRVAYPDLAESFDAALSGTLPAGWDTESRS